MPAINVKMANNETANAQVVAVADYCPYCHKHQKPQIEQGFMTEKNSIKIVYRCTNTDCNEIFVSTYQRRDDGFFEFRWNETGIPKSEDFGDEIEKISGKFVQIYNEAIEAESHNLEEISGVGFRKALEFLMKDYCIQLHPDDKEKIIKMTLANVIKTYVKDVNIKSIAQRAVWLGNDETHYYRKWEGKTVEDVKNLIELTVYWIKMERLTNSIISEMSE